MASARYEVPRIKMGNRQTIETLISEARALSRMMDGTQSLIFILIIFMTTTIALSIQLHTSLCRATVNNTRAKFLRQRDEWASRITKE